MRGHSIKRFHRYQPANIPPPVLPMQASSTQLTGNENTTISTSIHIIQKQHVSGLRVEEKQLNKAELSSRCVKKSAKPLRSARIVNPKVLVPEFPESQPLPGESIHSNPSPSRAPSPLKQMSRFIRYEILDENQ